MDEDMRIYNHYDHVSIAHNNISFDIDLSKFQNRIKKAQMALDLQVFTDSKQYMPMQSGMFINLTQAEAMAEAGSGRVCVARSPFGRFLYFGKVMVDPVTYSPFARRGVRKIVTERDLNLSRGSSPLAQKMWFEVSKDRNRQNWINLVKNYVEGKYE